MAAYGLTTREIAARLSRADDTIENTLRAVTATLGITRRPVLVRYCVTLGVVWQPQG